MPIKGIQLPLFDEPPTPVAAPPIALFAFKEVEQHCTQLMMQGSRPDLVAYLSQLCDQGVAEWVERFCRLRTDFGLKVRSGQLVEFFQVGDTIQVLSRRHQASEKGEGCPRNEQVAPGRGQEKLNHC